MDDEATESPTGAIKAQHIALAIFFLALCALAAGVVFVTADLDLQDVSLKAVGLHYDWLKAKVAQAPLVAMAAYAGVYAMLGAFFLPGSAFFAVIGGLLFGVAAGIPLSVGASLVAALLAYTIARWFVGQRFDFSRNVTYRRLRAGFKRHALSYLLFLRITPGLPFPLLNVIPAVLGVPLATFALATFLGVLPSRIALSTAGAGLGRAIEIQNAQYLQCVAQAVPHGHGCAWRLEAGSLLTTETVAALVALGLLALLPVAARAMPRVKQRAGWPQRR